MSRIVSQTQDNQSPLSQSHEPRQNNTRYLKSMEHSELCAIDPGKNLFLNERLGIFGNRQSSKIIQHIINSSQYVKKLRSHVRNGGSILKQDAAEVIRDMVVCHVRSITQYC